MPQPSDNAPRTPVAGGGPNAGRDQLWTVGELLDWTGRRFSDAGIDSGRTDAEHLLAEALGCTRVSLYVRHAEIVRAEAKATFRELVRRRLRREPVAYVLGRRGFHALDLELRVDARVLVPRPETEHLVDWLLEELRPAPAPPMDVLDVGTGSGAIALAIARARPDVRVVGSDLHADALEVARSNASVHGLAVELVHADLLQGVDVPEGGWTAIAANLPYVPTGDLAGLQPEVALHEPKHALDGGVDGLDAIRRLVAQVRDRGALRPHGALYLEIGIGQAETVQQILTQAGFEGVQTRADWAGIPRIARGFFAGAPRTA
jgi:release factor glutamine methyltransferase